MLSMNKLFLAIIALLLSSSVLYAGPIDPEKSEPTDTLYTELKKDVVVLSSTKETNSLRTLPAAVSIFSQKNLEALQVHSFKDLSGIIPNYFAADYGSKMTAPLYIRGVGARSGYQTVSMYVDNIPYFNTTSFDTELFDIQRVEVLRGTQGTLYGRNAMGGIMNVYTYSPITYQGSRIRIGGGSDGYMEAQGSTYINLNENAGVMFGAYYNQNDGYFKNEFNGKDVDDLKNGGARFKAAWNITPRLYLAYSANLDVVKQGAFPYHSLETGKIDMNSEGFYNRHLFTNGLSLRYSGKGYEINSTTGYQYLNDDMNMDNDLTAAAIFEINQRQRQNSVSQEFTIKSTNNSWYQWSAGAFGFYDYKHTTPPVYMMKDGIQKYMQGMMDQNIPADYKAMMNIKFTDEELKLDGNYKQPTHGLAIFHQSTFNDIFVKGLSATLGARLDYEKSKLTYNSPAVTHMDMRIGPPMMPTKPYVLDTLISGNASEDYFVFLPKAVLKYEFNPASYIYASASRGYKAGGHNIQMFADLLQEAVMARTIDQVATELPGLVSMGMPAHMIDRIIDNLPKSDKTPVNDRITYKPEYSWNYELGGQQGLFDNRLLINYALFWMDIKDVQLTQFVESGSGRIVANGGKARSRGFELGMKARPCEGFYLYANYGFVDAKFREYITDGLDENGKKVNVDYSDNRIPFAPRSTFSVGGNVSYDVKRCPVVDRISLDMNYSGVGEVYWNEANSMSQGYYGTFNATLGLEKGAFSLNVWGKNIFDREYNTFVFESGKQYFGQLGKPARWGASLTVKL